MSASADFKKSANCFSYWSMSSSFLRIRVWFRVMALKCPSARLLTGKAEGFLCRT